MAASASPTCPVCMDDYGTGKGAANLAKYPVLFPECGHTFCLSCSKAGRLAVGQPCPTCRTPRRSENLPRNFALEDAIALALGARRAHEEQVRALQAQLTAPRSSPYSAGASASASASSAYGAGTGALMTLVGELTTRLDRAAGRMEALEAAGGARALAWAERQRAEAAEREAAAAERQRIEALQRAAEEAERRRAEEEAERQRAAEAERQRAAEAERQRAAAAAAAAVEAEAAAARARAAQACHNCKQTTHRVQDCPWRRGGHKRPRN